MDYYWPPRRRRWVTLSERLSCTDRWEPTQRRLCCRFCPFEKGGLNSRLYDHRYTAAALATENKVLAHPASVDTIPYLDQRRGPRQHGNGGGKAPDPGPTSGTSLAIELLTRRTGIDFRRRVPGPEVEPVGAGTNPAYTLIRQRARRSSGKTYHPVHRQMLPWSPAAGWSAPSLTPSATGRRDKGDRVTAH